MSIRPITISLSPNAESDDVKLALKTMFSPYMWKEGDATREAEQWFCNYFSADSAVSFNSGRSALLAILKAFDIGKGDEVLVQAFTCVAVPNSVLWAGGKPVYVDIDDTLNMDAINAEKKITKHTKAMIIQHTFGVPAQMDTLMKLAKKHHLIVIEDCAHSLGAAYLPAGKAGKGKKVGTFGDAAFFSFGRDKVVSSVFGGMAIINAKCQMPNAKLKLRQYQEKLSFPSDFWIFQQLLHPIAFSLILMSYNLIVGKLFLVVLQKLRLLSFPVYPEEKKGRRPNDFPAKFPNALAVLLINQLKKLDRYNENRKQVADFYRSKLKERDFDVLPHADGAIYLRFAVLSPYAAQIIKKSRQDGVYLGNWYHHVIDPTGVDYQAIDYTPGSCPKAEQAAQHIVNLPTRIPLHQAGKVVATILTK